MPKPFDIRGAWEKFVWRSFPLRHVPFLDFVLGSGSMALGTASEKSDFDVIVGARQGRIFTVRFFSVLFVGFFGWRRRRLDHRESGAEKICLNHFVTPRSYRLSPPYNDYWRNLYAQLVPIVGDTQSIKAFLEENNDWAETAYVSDSRHRYRKSWFAKFLEVILRGKRGDLLEEKLKRYQISRIERNFPNDTEQFRPRIRYTDDELEFHPIGFKEL